ncbi:MAG: radical SAM protein [Clostridia bacterium]|nr:radical SAM protein [Clostridia bacterium]
MEKKKTINPEASEPAVSTYLHAIAKQKGIPLSGTFEITGRCNFNCKMCYVHDSDCNKMKSSELPAEWWINLGKEAAQAGTVFLLITGGEPLLRDDFEEIYTELNKMGFVISLNTNGYLLNGKYKELFRKYPPNRINVSIYGSDDDAYERFSGVRGFSRVINNVLEMREMGVDVRFNCSITPDNCSDMENIFNVCRDLGFHVKTTSYMYPRIRVNGVHGENDNRLSSEDAAKYRVEWSKLRYGRDDFMSRAIGMKQKIEELSVKEPMGNPAEGVMCRAGGTSFWVSKEGKMSICGMIDKMFDIEENGFLNAWEKVKAYRDEILLPIECANCAYRYLCNVCAAVCYAETGDFSKKPEYVCRFTKETARLTQLEFERFEKNGD